jgi:O-antigen ligase
MGRTLAQVSVLFMALAIPLSTALDNVLLALLLVSGMTVFARAYWDNLRHHPVARANILLFVALTLGCMYGAASASQAINMLAKYIDLAFVPLLIAVFAEEKLREWAWKIFLSTMALTAFLSWLVGTGHLPVQGWMWEAASIENPAIFRSSITQNILMSYAAYIFVSRSCSAATAKYRWIYAVLAMLTASSVLFLVQGRSGYLILLFAALLIIFRLVASRGGKLTIRHLGAILLLLPVMLWGMYEAVPRLHQRVDVTIEEYQAWYPHGRQSTSIGERMEFYYNTATIIKEHPLLGVGTGGFALVYAQQAAKYGINATNNPHNEYLHLTVQLGIIGMALFLYLIYLQWQNVGQLKDRQAGDAAAGLVLTLMVTSLFNTPLMDHTEGLFFAYMSALCFSTLRQKVSHG